MSWRRPQEAEVDGQMADGTGRSAATLLLSGGSGVPRPGGSRDRHRPPGTMGEEPT